MHRLHSKLLAAVVLVLVVGACGEGSSSQIASNSKQDRGRPAATGPATTAAPRKKNPPKTAAATSAPARKTTIAIKDDLFDPAKVEVAAGDAVMWTWEGKDPHNVDGPGFKSKIQSSGGTFTKVFAKTGTFDYRCDVHPTMKASVVVTG
jgi:plastocyanin